MLVRPTKLASMVCTAIDAADLELEASMLDGVAASERHDPEAIKMSVKVSSLAAHRRGAIDPRQGSSRRNGSFRAIIQPPICSSVSALR